MISFQRGVSVRESLGLGEFTGISKNLKDFFGKLMAGGLESAIWSTESNTYSVEPKEMDFKNSTDRGGGNSHKFYVRLVLNDFSNYGSIKEKIKSYKWQMAGYLSLPDEGFKLNTMNFYIGKKYFSKVGFEYKSNSFLVEVVYNKIKR